jgi:hypothetical protein
MRYPDEAERAIKRRKPVDLEGSSPRRMYRCLARRLIRWFAHTQAINRTVLIMESQHCLNEMELKRENRPAGHTGCLSVCKIEYSVTWAAGGLRFVDQAQPALAPIKSSARLGAAPPSPAL